MGVLFTFVYCYFCPSLSWLLIPVLTPSYTTETTREKETYLSQVLNEYGLTLAQSFIAGVNPLFLSIEADV